MYKHMRFLLPLSVGLICSGGMLVSKAKLERTSEWQHAEKKAEDTVVQVVAQHTIFNWIEPYKAPKQKENTGTAFFIDSQGTLLTNFHVIDTQKTAQIYLPKIGQKPIGVDVIGVCPEADLALIKVTPDGLQSIHKTLKTIPYLRFGDSDSLFPTEPVLALGYPLGQRYLKSTVGVVAGREYIDGRSFMHITAPINPGNSGGPLLNLDGKVVGINSAGVLTAQNYGFIIPSYEASILLQDLAKTRLVRKPNLGIRFNMTTDEHAQLLGNPLPAGVYINTVETSSVAQKAGLKAGDMLYEINGYEIDSYGDVSVNWQCAAKISLDEYLIRLPLNKKLGLKVYRKGKELNLTCIFTAPKPLPVRYIYPDYEPEALDYEVVGGMCIMQLRLNHIDFFDRIVSLQKYRLPENQHEEALIITKLLPGSPLHRISCFYEGSLLTHINDTPVCTLSQVRTALKTGKKGLVSFTTKDNVSTAVSAQTLAREEERLTRDYMFQSTPAMRELKKAYAEKPKTQPKKARSR